jgi:two-component system, NarL family, response regulator DevR
VSAGPEQDRVMIVDDHTSFRQPLAFMLDREPELTVVAQAGSVAEAREALHDAEGRIDLAVVDLRLPDGSGAELIAEMRALKSPPQALVLSGVRDHLRLARAIDAGAAGILHKSARFEEIVDAVRRLRSGEQLIPPQELIEAVRLVGWSQTRDQEAQLLIGRLTPRERDLLKALAEGLSDKKIAERLYVGEGTVRSHMTHILSKLEVDSRLQALIFAIRHGLVELS